MALTSLPIIAFAKAASVLSNEFMLLVWLIAEVSAC